MPTTVRDAFDGDDRVEPGAGRVDADPLLDRVEALLLDHLRHREDLGDRLNRDLGLDVAGGVDLAVDGHQRDAEQVRIDLGERRDVVGVLAFLERLELIERVVDGGLRIAAPGRESTSPTDQPLAADARERSGGAASRSNSVTITILPTCSRSCT